MNTAEAITLLETLIAIPSFSREENGTADHIEAYLKGLGISTERLQNNVWAKNARYNEAKPTLLLNSHHDTVKATGDWKASPHEAITEGEKLTGLGSNDAGASLVSLMSVFVSHYNKELPFNLIYAASAEEEISGKQGMELLREHLSPIALAIVGEPTQMELAVAEKGLMVVDCIYKGKAGHAARKEGINAIYKAMKDIHWIEHHQFPKVSEHLGEVNMAVTIINAGKQHNVVPAECHFTIDVRSTDQYSNEEVLKTLKDELSSEVNARSTRLNPSGIDKGHPICRVAQKLDLKTYGSPTLSDQALMPWPSVKIGPGNSARSHTANEYILHSEIDQGIEIYTNIIKELTHETLG